jgi:hypothetical protein
VATASAVASRKDPLVQALANLVAAEEDKVQQGSCTAGRHPCRSWAATNEQKPIAHWACQIRAETQLLQTRVETWLLARSESTQRQQIQNTWAQRYQQSAQEAHTVVSVAPLTRVVLLQGRVGPMRSEASLSCQAAAWKEAPQAAPIALPMPRLKYSASRGQVRSSCGSPCAVSALVARVLHQPRRHPSHQQTPKDWHLCARFLRHSLGREAPMRRAYALQACSSPTQLLPRSESTGRPRQRRASVVSSTEMRDQTHLSRLLEMFSLDLLGAAAPTHTLPTREVTYSRLDKHL